MNSLKDTMTEKKQVEQALENRLRFERRLSDLLPGSLRYPLIRLIRRLITAGTNSRILPGRRAGLMRSLPDKSVYQITTALQRRCSACSSRDRTARIIYPWAFEKLAEKHEVVSFSSSMICRWRRV